MKTQLLLQDAKKGPVFDVNMLLLFSHQLAIPPLNLGSSKSLTTTSWVTSETIQGVHNNYGLALFPEVWVMMMQLDFLFHVAAVTSRCRNIH